LLTLIAAIHTILRIHLLSVGPCVIGTNSALLPRERQGPLEEDDFPRAHVEVSLGEALEWWPDKVSWISFPLFHSPV